MELPALPLARAGMMARVEVVSHTSFRLVLLEDQFLQRRVKGVREELYKLALPADQGEVTKAASERSRKATVLRC